MAEVMPPSPPKPAAVLERLIAAGNRPDLARLYADAYCEYHEAQANIAVNGAICANPRTGAPMTNPYLEIRDRARQQLLRMANVKTPGLWPSHQEPTV